MNVSVHFIYNYIHYIQGFDLLSQGFLVVQIFFVQMNCTHPRYVLSLSLLPPLDYIIAKLKALYATIDEKRYFGPLMHIIRIKYGFEARRCSLQSSNETFVGL